jgi:hypothetical protein
MNLNEWRKKQNHGEIVTLPSGLEVTLRKASIMDLAERGQIPAPLAGTVNEMMRGGGKRTYTLSDFAEFSGIINVVAGACIVDPPVAEVGDDSHLALTELPIEDRLQIFNWANGEANHLIPFRKEDGEPATAARPGHDVLLPAIVDPGDFGQLDSVSD